MRDDDAPVVLSSHLQPEEAGLLRGLLESAGIAAAVRDDMLCGVNPFLRPAIGGVKLAVRAADAERALEIVRAAGVLGGLGPAEPVEIPEAEWSRPAPPETDHAPAPGRPPGGRWTSLSLAAAAGGALLLLGLLRGC